MLLGAELEVPNVVGSVQVTLPKGMQHGETLKVAGEGLPSLRGSRRGDLYFKLEVVFPKKLEKDEERALRELAEKRGVELKATSKKDSGFWGRKK
jgi:molecular chaperone DnaJ